MNIWDIVEIIEPTLFLIVFLLISFYTKSIRVILLSFLCLGTIAFITLYNIKILKWTLNYYPLLLQTLLILAIFFIIIYFLTGFIINNKKLNKFDKKNSLNKILDIFIFSRIQENKKIKIFVLLFLFIIFSLLSIIWSLSNNIIK